MRTAAFLRNVPVLAGLSDEPLERLARHVGEVHVRAGDWIMRECEAAESLFIVKSGRIEVIDEGPREVLIRILRRGDVLGELALLREGTRSASARARRDTVGFSICIPILAPPQVRGRELFIDGSFIDNLPVQVMSDLGEGTIIAVDVKMTFERAPGGRPTERPARAERIPSLGETLTRVLLLGSANTSDAARRHADLVIKPRAEGVGLLEFHQLDAAREAGRAAAREALETAPASLFG
jgi:Cyclic nucleotide-binding domain